MRWRNQTLVSFSQMCSAGDCTNVYFDFPQKVKLLTSLSIRQEKRNILKFIRSSRSY